MFDSKALKEFPKERSSSKLYLWWIQTPVAEWYFDFMHKFIENPFFQAKRLVQWYWNVFRFDYDFDANSLYAIIEYKLKRVEKCLLNGHAIQEDKDLHALRLAIKLAKRLHDDKYHNAFRARHDRKWGEMKTWTEDTERGDGSVYWRSSRPKADTPEKKDLEAQEHLAFLHAEEAQKNRERKWFFNILSTYLAKWWD